MTAAPPTRSTDSARRGGETVRHSAARLAAVQALYQIDITGAMPGTVIDEFVKHRLGPADIEASRGAKANETLFRDLVHGACDRVVEIDGRLGPLLAKGWSIERIEVILRNILRLGALELLTRPEVPASVVIKEYVDLADAFFSGAEPGVVNAILDRLARDLRPGELEARHDGPARPSG